MDEHRPLGMILVSAYSVCNPSRDHLDHVSPTQHREQHFLRRLVPAVLLFKAATRVSEHLIRHILVAQADPDCGAQVNRQRVQANIHLFS